MKKPICACAKKKLRLDAELEIIFDKVMACMFQSITVGIGKLPKRTEYVIIDTDRKVHLQQPIYLDNNFCAECGAPYEEVPDEEVPVNVHG